MNIIKIVNTAEPYVTVTNECGEVLCVVEYHEQPYEILTKVVRVVCDELGATMVVESS